MIAGLVKQLSIGALVAAGISAIANVPAFAGTLADATIEGGAPTDYLVYDVSSKNTVIVDSTVASVRKVLDGNSSNPTGNVELGASSERASFDFTKYTSLTGTIGDKAIALSSLAETDWNRTFATQWFNAVLNANGFGSLLANTSLYNTIWNKFINNGGRERFSDPNIAYVNQDDSTGKIRIGLAGHYDATSLLLGNLSPTEQAAIGAFRDPNQKDQPIQASEIVKYSYNGVTDYLYGFSATPSGLVSDDRTNSHNGNYELWLNGISPEKVPEPSAIFALIGLGGFLAAKRKAVKNA